MSKYIWMKKMLSASALFFAIATSVFTPTRAYSFNIETTSGGDTVKWSSSAATFLVNTTNGPSFALTSIQSAMDNWTSVASSNLVYTYGGSTSNSEQTNNSENIVFFGDAPSGFVGWATFWYVSGGAISDCDIIIEEDFTWTETYLEDLATHEFGHCVPLAHASGSVTMNATVSAGARFLAQDDVDGITFLYDKGTGYSEAFVGVPTMNEWGMMLFISLACGIAVYNIRRVNDSF